VDQHRERLVLIARHRLLKNTLEKPLISIEIGAQVDSDPCR